MQQRRETEGQQPAKRRAAIPSVTDDTNPALATPDLNRMSLAEAMDVLRGLDSGLIVWCMDLERSGVDPVLVVEEVETIMHLCHFPTISLLSPNHSYVSSKAAPRTTGQM